jgi:microcin C transport system substrate-binding protein
MCFPKDGNLKASQLPLEKFVDWIDEDKKKETLKAMHDGRSYGEVSHVYDQYRER